MSFTDFALDPLDALSDAKGVTKEELFLLTRLDLRRVGPEALPEEIGRLTNLKELLVRFENVTDESVEQLPNSITALTGLTKLHIENANFVETPNFLLACTQLRYLTITDGQLRTFPERCYQLSNLQALILSHNNIRFVPRNLHKLPNLEHVDFSHNIISFKSTLVWGDDTYRIADSDRQIPLAMSSMGSHQACELTRSSSPLSAEICLMPKCQFLLGGNKDMPGRTSILIRNLFAKHSDPIKRSIKMYRILGDVPDIDPRILDSFQLFGCRLTNERFSENIDEEEIISIIRLAIFCKALRFLEVHSVQKYVKRLWSNNATREYYIQKSGREPPSRADIKSWMFFWARSYFDVILPRFFASVRARFMLSFFMYLFFLATLVSYTISKSTTGDVGFFTITQQMKDNFQVTSVQSSADFWDYLENTFLPAYANGPYALSNVPGIWGEDMASSFYRPVGGVRLRQQRVKPKKCDFQMKGYSVTSDPMTPPQMCSPPFSLDNEDTGPHGIGGVFTYSHGTRFARIPRTSATGSLYGTDGYIEVLAANISFAKIQIESLKENNWFDLNTRHIVIDAILSIDNLDCLTFTELSFEFLPNGASSSSIVVTNIPKEWVLGGDAEPYIFHTILVCWVVSLAIFQFQRIPFTRSRGRVDSWFLYDFVILVLFCFGIAMEIAISRMSHSERFLESYTKDDLVDLVEISYLYEYEVILIGIVNLLSFVRLLFFTSAHPYLGPMQAVVRTMLSDIGRFFLFLAAFLAAFCAYFYTVYSGSIKEFSTVGNSLFVTTNAIFGNFDIDPIVEHHPFLGKIDTFIFSAAIIIVLLNFLIAVLSGTYEEVRAESVLQYKRLFVETILFLKQAPLTPPLNLATPILYVIQVLSDNRSGVWSKMLPWSAFQDTFRHMFPFPVISSLLSGFSRTADGYITYPIDLLSIAIYWILCIAFLVLSIPLVLVSGKVSKAAQKGVESAILYLVYFLFLVVWYATLPLWSIFYYFGRLINAMVVRAFGYHGAFEEPGDGDVCFRVAHIAPSYPKDRLLQDTDIASVSLSSESLHDDYILSCRQVPRDCLVSQFVWVNDGRSTDRVTFMIFDGAAIIGFLPSQKVGNFYPGIERYSGAYNSVTGDIIYDGVIVGHLEPLSLRAWNIVDFVMDYRSSSMIVTNSKSSCTIELKLLLGMQFCPSVRLMHENTFLIMRCFHRQPEFAFGLEMSQPFLVRESGHSKVVELSHPSVVYSSLSPTEYHTTYYPYEISAKDGQIMYFDYGIVDAGERGAITVGFSAMCIPNPVYLGDSLHTVGFTINTLHRKGTFIDHLHESEVPVMRANLSRVIGERLKSAGFLVDFKKLKFWVLVNHRIIPSLSRKLTDQHTKLLPSVTFNSSGQLVHMKISSSVPEALMKQVEFVESSYGAGEAFSFADIHTAADVSVKIGSLPRRTGSSLGRTGAFESILSDSRLGSYKK